MFLRAVATMRRLLLVVSWWHWWYGTDVAAQAAGQALAATTGSTFPGRRLFSLVSHHHPHLYPLHSPGMTANCTGLYFEQRLDHFAPAAANKTTTYRQRYFINDAHYTPGGPMFFYLGNEADVTLYVNATGLMWENAARFGALVVFAEHRFYGKSQPFPRNSTSDDSEDYDPPLSQLRYLSAEQALADYAVLIGHLKATYNFDQTQAVIGFGGSYGGMLASWGRMKYPHVWDGAIAASAPIASFEGMDPPVNPNFFAEGVTYDVTTKAGVSSPYCERNLRKLFADQALTKKNDDDNIITPTMIRTAFKICKNDNTTDEDIGGMVTGWIDEALSYMAMGNFPYPSGYILNGNGLLPAFPVRVACESLAKADMTGDDQVEEWLEGLAEFASVYYNYTGRLECNSLSAPVNPESQIVGKLWNYQYCSEIFQLFGQSTDENDMFADNPWDGDAVAQGCFDQYGFWPDRLHFPVMYGSKPDWARTVSNIVWSNGEYDPWKGGGVTEDLNDSAVAVVISEAAHHLDLFFSHENDTDAVVNARKLEMDHVQKWINEKKKKKKQPVLRQRTPVLRQQTPMAKQPSSRFWSLFPVAEALPLLVEKTGRHFDCSTATENKPVFPIKKDTVGGRCRGRATRKANWNGSSSSSSSGHMGSFSSVLSSLLSSENNIDDSSRDSSAPDYRRPISRRASLKTAVIVLSAFLNNVDAGNAAVQQKDKEEPTTDQSKDNYGPASAFVREEITRIIQNEDPTLAGSILRLAFHDATVRSVASQPYDVGGSDGSIRYELDWPENRGLSKPLNVVTDVYELQQTIFSNNNNETVAGGTPVTPSPLSFADTLALSGAAAVEAAHGPKIQIKMGRKDVLTADSRFLDVPIGEEGVMGERAIIARSLPSPGLDSLGLRNYFNRLGLTEQELVAISGAHDLGRHVTLTGMPKQCLRNLTRTCLENAPVLAPFITSNPDTLSNKYFQTLLKWNNNNIQYGEAAFIPTDVALVVDDGLKKHVVDFANHEQLFFERFRTAYQKLVDTTASSECRF